MHFFGKLIVVVLAALPVVRALAAEDPGAGLPPAYRELFSVIHRVADDQATSSFEPRPEVLNRMVDAGLKALTGKPDASAAWRAWIQPGDRVGIKVYSAVGGISGTRPALVEALVASLIRHGHPPGNIILWDRRLEDLHEAGFVEVARRQGVQVMGTRGVGYDGQVYYESSILGTLIWGDRDFGAESRESTRRSYVSSLVTSKMDKIISVTPLLNHNAAGIAGHLYGLSAGSVDNFHRFDSSRERLKVAVPEIVALEQIGDRVVLSVTDALIGQYLGESRSRMHDAAILNQLWFSLDPVALDVWGLRELERLRKEAGFQIPDYPRELYENASLLKIGRSSLLDIQIRSITP